MRERIFLVVLMLKRTRMHLRVRARIAALKLVFKSLARPPP